MGILGANSRLQLRAACMLVTAGASGLKWLIGIQIHQVLTICIASTKYWTFPMFHLLGNPVLGDEMPRHQQISCVSVGASSSFRVLHRYIGPCRRGPKYGRPID